MDAGINWIAVGAAGLAGFVFGALWYTVLAKSWMAAAGIGENDAKPGAGPMVTAAISQTVIAFVLYGVLVHTQGLSVSGGLICGALIWLGFIVTTMTVNHRFQGQPWSLTIIDAGHWLGVLLVQGVVIGLLS